MISKETNMDHIYTYQLGESLYINLTNECTNACDFCVRNNPEGVGSYDLWLEKEPTAEEVIERIPDPTRYQEIVFCGYGEPMMRLDTLLEVAEYIKDKGGKVRINTNGHANLIYNEDITPRLAGKVDIISISVLRNINIFISWWTCG